jgi:hypothetical protein
MAKNHAQRKAAKAAKRKMIVAEKKKQDAAANSVTGRLRMAAGLPILHCLVSNGLFDTGMGSVLLVRGDSLGEQYLAMFLLDTLALGVKDVTLRWADPDEASGMIEMLQNADPSTPMDPGETRKLLHDLAAWAGEWGFRTHEDYGKAESMFGTVAPAATDYRARFGRDGKPLYIPGPSESAAQIRRHLNLIEDRLGPEGLKASMDAIAEQSASALEDFGVQVEDASAPVLEGEAEEVTPDRPA